MEPVQITLGDLEITNLKAAFGPDSLGVIIIGGLGSRYRELRLKVLESARILANLPAPQLEELELPETRYQTGWSRGRETTVDNKPDTNKGSFYLNCNFTRTGLDHADAETAKRFPNPLYYHPNVWPKIPEFEANLKELVKIMVDIVVQVAAACDRTLDLPLTKSLESTLANSDVNRGRLLHYYQAQEDADWCGDHVDHSCLTILTSALWGPEDPHEPAGQAGLYIQSRNGTTVKASIPEDCVAIQSGSALELMTRGSFKAVPHRVVGDAKHYRSTLAVFCQPRLEDMVGDKTFAEHAGEIITKMHGKGD